MRTKYLFFVTFLAIAFGWGCSGSAETSGSAPGPKTNSGISSNNQTTPAANTEPGNSTVAQPPGSLPNRPGGKQIVDVPLSGPRPLPAFKKAGEDSQITTTMNADGDVLEIRVFNSHPKIVKAEVIWHGAKTKALKLFLRGGRIVEIETDRIENLQNASTGLLLEIAGLQAPVQAPGTSQTLKQTKRPAQ